MPTLEAFYLKQIASFKEKGSLGSVLPLCDVSGSMTGTPMSVSVAMGIWLSALAAPEFKDLVLTFTTRP